MRHGNRSCLHPATNQCNAEVFSSIRAAVNKEQYRAPYRSPALRLLFVGTDGRPRCLGARPTTGYYYICTRYAAAKTSRVLSSLRLQKMRCIKIGGILIYARDPPRLKNIASPVRGSLRSRDYRPRAVAPARLSSKTTAAPSVSARVTKPHIVVIVVPIIRTTAFACRWRCRQKITHKTARQHSLVRGKTKGHKLQGHLGDRHVATTNYLHCGRFRPQASRFVQPTLRRVGPVPP